MLIAAGVAVLAVAAGIGRWRSANPAAEETPVTFQRLTDIVGMEETPALSPDGKTVAYVAAGDGHRQIWVRPLAGGAAIQVTRDAVDHMYPRWAPDSGMLLYYVPPPQEGAIGSLWEMPYLGGTPQQIAAAMGAFDISYDGRRVVVFQPGPQYPVLTIVNRVDRTVERQIDVGRFAAYEWLRWSPDDRLIAFSTSQSASSLGFQRNLRVVPATGGTATQVASTTGIQGLAWLSGSDGLVYASSEGSTLAYPPIFNLRRVALDGSGDKALTFGDVSYVEPDVVADQVIASRVRIQSDVWRYPIFDSSSDVMAGGVRITHQTGQVQAPSASPDGKQVVYISDNGGHSNLWITNTDGTGTRQLTFERDPATVIGIPNWSPAGDRIVYVRSRDGVNAQWLIRPDGTGQPRELVARGLAATWTRDGRSLYFFDSDCIHKIPADGGTPAKVRCGRIGSPAISADGSTLYWARDDGRSGEIMRASPENGTEQVFARFSISRVPWWPTTRTLSPDGRWLATPFKDGATTNIWLLSTADGTWRQLTDFGDRATLITRIVSWASDSKSVFAVIAETDADVVRLRGLIR
jgi:Tol biopolymer transport system component